MSCDLTANNKVPRHLVVIERIYYKWQVIVLILQHEP